jgi:hypothetical protein
VHDRLDDFWDRGAIRRAVALRRSLERLSGMSKKRVRDSRAGRGLRESKTPVLDRLDSAEAAGVLRQLLAAHPELGSEAEQIAKSLLQAESFESIAEEIEQSMLALDIDDLNARAGAHEWGYVEPGDAADEILEETIEPFIADIERRVALGLEDAALQLCQGVVLGLYRVKRSNGGELAQWAPDFMGEAAGEAINTWLSGSRAGTAVASTAKRARPSFPHGFAERFVPEWQAMIQRILTRTRR